MGLEGGAAQGGTQAAEGAVQLMQCVAVCMLTLEHCCSVKRALPGGGGQVTWQQWLDDAQQLFCSAALPAQERAELAANAP